MIACVVVSAKQFFMETIACYIPVNPSGDDFNDFLSTYCWTHGTIPLFPNEKMPDSDDVWKEYDRHRRIGERLR